MSFLKAQVSFRSNVASIFSAIKHNSPILVLAQRLYTLFKRSPLKCNFLRFLSARVKLPQIPRVNSSSNFGSIFIVMTQNSPVNFKLIHFYFEKRTPSKSYFLGFQTCSGENLLNSCHF